VPSERMTRLNDFGATLPSPVQQLRDPALDRYGVELSLKRDDLIHPDVPGNKWRKLRLNLLEALAAEHDTLVTFGGAYSNHIRAVAAAGAFLGLRTIGLIRGEEHLPLNPTLAYARSHGMELSYVDRTTYRSKTDAEFLGFLHDRFGSFYLVPEGGSNALGVRGCADIGAELERTYDLVVCPSGTGGTLAGLSAGVPENQRTLGVAVLKGAGFLNDDVRRLQQEAFGRITRNWSIELNYHFGGFAKMPQELMAFSGDLEDRHGLRIERVYVAKMLYMIFDMARSGRVEPGTAVLAVITG
jgi:1-aminocyclopropane-1-carboxylate deaminase